MPSSSARDGPGGTNASRPSAAAATWLGSPTVTSLRHCWQAIHHEAPPPVHDAAHRPLNLAKRFAVEHVRVDGQAATRVVHFAGGGIL